MPGTTLPYPIPSLGIGGIQRYGRAAATVYGGSFLLFSQIGDSTAIASTNAETAFTRFPTLMAGSLIQGALLRTVAWGILSTTGTPTITLRTRFDSAAGDLFGSGVITTGNNAASQPWMIEHSFVMRTIGAAGVPEICPPRNSLLVAATPAFTLVRQVLASLNTTIDHTLLVTAQWSASDPANTITKTGHEVWLSYPQQSA